MRWPVFAIFAFLALVLERGLRVLWHVEVAGGVAPSLLLILAVFLTTWAPASAAMWAALVLGLLADARPLLLADGQVGAILGPAALGFLAGAWCVLRLRAGTYRDSPVAVAALVFVAGLIVHLVAVAVLTLRGWMGWNEPLPEWSAAGTLLQGFLEVLYTVALAVPVGWLLLRHRGWWGFEGLKGFSRRR